MVPVLQNLAFKVTSLSEEVRELIKEFINLTANSGTSRFAVLQSLKEVISVMMDDHHLPDNWLVHLLNLVTAGSGLQCASFRLRQ